MAMNDRSNTYLLLLACLGLICLLGLASYLSEQSLRQKLQQKNQRELIADLDAIERSLGVWFEEQKASAVVWANTTEVRNFALRLNEAQARQQYTVMELLQLELRHWLSPLHSGRGLQGFMILDRNGVILASNLDEALGKPSELQGQTAFLDSLWAGRASVGLPPAAKFPLADASGQLQDEQATLFAGAPVLNDDDQVIAAFVFRINPADFTRLFSRVSAGDSSESLAYREDGVLLVAGDSRPSRPSAAQAGAGPSGESQLFNAPGESGQSVPIPFYQPAVISGTRTQLDGYVNYRGERVIAARRWLPEYGLGIAEEADFKQHYALLGQMRSIIWSLTVFAVILMAVMAYIILSRRRSILESRQRFSGIIEMSEEAIISIDEAESIILFNPAAQRIFGYSEAEMLGRQLSVLIPPRLRDAHHEHVKMFSVYWEPVIRKTQSRNLLGLRKNGEEFPLEATVSRQQVGRQKVLTVALRDISEQVRAQAALVREQRKAKRYLDSVLALIIAIDTEGRIKLINRKAREMIGLVEGEIINQAWFDNNAPQDDALCNLSIPLKTMLKEKTPESVYFECTLMSSLDEERVIGWHSSLLTDERGRVIGVLCAGIDLTDAKQAERDRDRLQRQLMRAAKSEAVGQLAGGIAHDFNNMLATISGYTELSISAQEGADSTDIRDYLEQILTTCRRAAGLVQKLLAFSRGEETELVRLSMARLGENTFKMLGSVLPSSIRLLRNVSDDMADVMADPVQLDQVLVNLCINARDAMNGKGTIEVGLREVSCRNEECVSCHKSMTGQYVELSVQDSGSGIDPRVIENIFDPFFTTKEVGKGTGLGLSIVHGIVHGHQGHIKVDSGEWGTRFRLYLPVAEHQPQSRQTGQTVNRPLAATVSGGSRHILLVDDEPSVTHMLSEVLKLAGFRVTAFTDSVAALREFKIRPEAFDLVLTDQTMPRLTGTEIIKEILALQPEIPTVLCSGYSTAIDERSAFNLGIRAYFEKPMDTSVLLMKLMELLEMDIPPGAGAGIDR